MFAPNTTIASIVMTMKYRGSSITNRSLVPEDLLRMLERVIDRTHLVDV